MPWYCLCVPVCALCLRKYVCLCVCQILSASLSVCLSLWSVCLPVCLSFPPTHSLFLSHFNLALQSRAVQTPSLRFFLFLFLQLSITNILQEGRNLVAILGCCALALLVVCSCVPTCALCLRKCVCLCVCQILSVCQSLSLSISGFLSVYVRLICLSESACLCLFVSVSLFLSVSLSACLLFSVCVYLSVCRSLSLTLSPLSLSLSLPLSLSLSLSLTFTLFCSSTPYTVQTPGERVMRSFRFFFFFLQLSP